MNHRAAPARRIGHVIERQLNELACILRTRRTGQFDRTVAIFGRIDRVITGHTSATLSVGAVKSTATEPLTVPPLPCASVTVTRILSTSAGSAFSESGGMVTVHVPSVATVPV